jgi:pyrroloquinoline quinone (PQQ) biosynthesis protein C
MRIIIFVVDVNDISLRTHRRLMMHCVQNVPPYRTDYEGDAEKGNLLAYLIERAEHYRVSILALQSDESHYDFDDARNDFLEDLWDVIYPHLVDIDKEN